MEFFRMRVEQPERGFPSENKVMWLSSSFLMAPRSLKSRRLKSPAPLIVLWKFGVVIENTTSMQQVRPLP